MIALFQSQPFSCKFHPSLERDLKVHHREEWIDTVLLFDDAVENVFIGQLFGLVLNIESYQVDSILSLQLENLHFLSNLHISVFPSHAPIQKFIEVDVSIITLDCHFQQLFLELAILIVMFTETKGFFFVTFFTEFSKEFSELIFFDFLAVVFIHGVLFPDFHESRLIGFEFGNHVILGQVILLKLLDDNQNKQIEHNMGTS
jgi:hypothetical protein